MKIKSLIERETHWFSLMVTGLEKINETSYYIKFVGISPSYFVGYGLAEIYIDPAAEDYLIIATKTDNVTADSPISEII